MTARTDLQIDDERSAAARHLLRHPWVTRKAAPEMFTTIVLHRDWLIDRFDRYCGWPLHIDVPAGAIKLQKRPARVDGRRGFVRRNGSPFDRRRCALWASVCAELLIRPLQTIADLADVIEDLHADPALVDFDSAVQGHRHALVDVLHWLIDHDSLAEPVGDLDSYVTATGDVVLRADQTRLTMLLSTPQPPARMPQHVQDDPDAAVRWLMTEPRYGAWGTPGARPAVVPAEESRPDADARNLYGRHVLARMLLDDPAVETVDMDLAVGRYATSLEGRRRSHEIADFLGLSFEQHADVQLMIDDTRETTDVTALHPPSSHRIQAAAAILIRLLTGTVGTVDDATALIEGLLADDDRWATTRQGHADAFTGDAIDHLLDAGLCRRATDGRLRATAAAHRLRVAVADHRDTDDPTPLTLTGHLEGSDS